MNSKIHQRVKDRLQTLCMCVKCNGYCRVAAGGDAGVPAAAAPAAAKKARATKKEPEPAGMCMSLGQMEGMVGTVSPV